MKLYVLNPGATIVEPPFEGDENPFVYLGKKYIAITSGDLPAGNIGMDIVDWENDLQVRSDAMSAMLSIGPIESMGLGEKRVYGLLSKPTAEERIKAVSRSVVDLAETVRRVAIGDAGHLKVAGWTAKVDRANRILSGQPTPDDLRVIGAEAAIRQATPQEQAARIVAAAARYGELNGYIEGLESELLDLVASGQAGKVSGFVEEAKETLPDQTRETIGAWVETTVQTLAAALGRKLG